MIFLVNREEDSHSQTIETGVGEECLFLIKNKVVW